MSEENAISAPIVGTANVAELIPYFNNPRIHSDAVIDQMIESIRAFGFRIPVLVKYSEDGPEIIDGHLRLKAAIKMGLTEVPILDASDMTAEQIRAFRIMVNRSVNWADWDEAKLLEEMQLISDSELSEMFSMADLTGFETAEMDAIFTQDDPNLDIEKEWNGMPEFTQQDKTAFKSISVHFPDQAAIDKFAKLIDQKITPETKMCWFPQIEIESYADKEYQSDKS